MFYFNLIRNSIYLFILNTIFRSSNNKHSSWIHRSSGSSHLIHNSTMAKFSAFLVILLVFTSRKSLARLVIESFTDEYGESSIIEAVLVSFFSFTIFKPLKYSFMSVTIRSCAAEYFANPMHTCPHAEAKSGG